MAVSAPPTLVFEIFSGMTLAVVCQTAEHPTDDEWDAYLVAIGRVHTIKTYRFLVVTDGGHPSRSQQQRLQALTRNERSRVAIISAAVSLRFVTSIFNLVNPNVKCYHPLQRPAAFDHLGIGPDETAAVARMIERVQERLARGRHATA